MNHSFNVEVAKEVGVLAATIFNNIGHWVNHNRATGRNLIDGRNWTYNSVRAFAEQFPYATDGQIAGALKKLREAGLVDTGQYCEDKRDRSLWYTLSERGEEIFYGNASNQQEECIAQNNGMDSANSENDYISTDVNADGKPDTKQLKEILAYLNEKTGRSYRLGKKARELMEARLKEHYTLNDFKKVIDNMTARWKGTKFEQYLQPSTLFAPSHFDEYLNKPAYQPAQDKNDRRDQYTDEQNQEFDLYSWDADQITYL